MCYREVFFFFSSRRRHTRSLCDWSSDVCSSDLFDLRSDRQFELSQGLGVETAGARGAAQVLGQLELAVTAQVEQLHALVAVGIAVRSEERRVGKECRSRGSPYH